jgi:electron transfer flavoprotein alpha subunit
MKEIIVVAEHRRGELRDVTWEMLSKGRQLAESTSAELGVALLGKGMNPFAEALKPKVKRVLLIEDPRLEAFDPETYKKVLIQLITERRPFLTPVWLLP